MNPTITARQIAIYSAGAVAFVCLFVYLRALSCDFVNFDDPYYIIDNPVIRKFNPQMLVSVFTETHAGWWMPLTWISFAADYHFWGLDPKGYHLTNILLHAANSAIVVLIAARILALSPGKEEKDLFRTCMPLLAGLIFAIHPLRVESVVWVTERKDVLNGIFSLGSVYCYLLFAGEKMAGKTGKKVICLYLFSLTLFTLSLMAKPVSVVIPALLLLLDWSPLQRFGAKCNTAVIAEKIPFMIISAAMIIVTIMTSLGKEGFFVATSDLSFPLRILVAGNSVIEYCRLMVLPVGILPLYVLDPVITYPFVIKTVLAIAFTACAVLLARRKPLVLTIWLSFIIPLLPVLGFLQNGDQSHAARFTYLPSVGPSIAVAAFCASAGRQATGRRKALSHVIILFIGCTFIFYAWMSLRLIDVWHDTGTLWSRVIDSKPMGRAYRERGFFYLSTGRYAEAISDFTTALDIAANLQRNDIFNLYAYRGEALRKKGLYEEAISDFRMAIALKPHPRYYYRLGLALREAGKVTEAAENFRLAGHDSGPIELFTP